jgi:ribonucleotide reductase beta subunit family protein with ferritin-like domain
MCWKWIKELLKFWNIDKISKYLKFFNNSTIARVFVRYEAIFHTFAKNEVFAMVTFLHEQSNIKRTNHAPFSYHGLTFSAYNMEKNNVCNLLP